MTSLDTRGIRESHLYIMLQKIEGPFRELAKRDLLGTDVVCRNEKKTRDEVAELSSSPGSNVDTESPSSTVCGASSDILEPSSSFKIELGGNGKERENALMRYQDLQIWTWKESFNASVLRAMNYGKKQCTPLLGVCNTCLDSYMIEDGFCPSCHTATDPEDRESFLDQNFFEEKLRNGPENFIASNPLRIRMMKALLSCLEASVPYDALQSSWTEDIRKAWALRLFNASCTEDLLQILTQYEGVIKRDHLSSDFETTEELLGYCAMSKGVAYNSARSGYVLQLPWIPQTAAAVALRFFELDAAIFYRLREKPESSEEKKVENFIKLSSRYPHLDDRQMKEESWEYKNINAPGNSKYKQVIRGRGTARPRRKWPKGVSGSVSEYGKKSVKHSQSLTQVLMQQGEVTYGQKHVRGPRTLRKRRTEKTLAQETLTDHFGERTNVRIVSGISRNSSYDADKEANANMEAMEEQSNSLDDAMDSDDNVPETSYQFGKWDTGLAVPQGRINNDATAMSDVDGDDSEEDENCNNVENLEEDLGINDYDSDRPGDLPSDEGSDSLVSGDYSD